MKKILLGAMATLALAGCSTGPPPLDTSDPVARQAYYTGLLVKACPMAADHVSRETQLLSSTGVGPNEQPLLGYEVTYAIPGTHEGSVPGGPTHPKWFSGTIVEGTKEVHCRVW